MPKPPPTVEDRKRRKELAEELLKEGWHPPGYRDGRGALTTEMARRAGLTRSGVHGWFEHEQREESAGREHFHPDWSLYRPPRRPDIKPTKSVMDAVAASEMPPPDPEQKPSVRIRYVPDDMQDYKVVGIGDAHDSPKLPDKSRFRWAGKFIAEKKPDIVIQIGDFFTFDSINSYDAPGSGRHRQLPTFREDIESGEQALSALDEGLDGYECEKHCTLGNHEDRVLSYEDRNPQVEAMLQLEHDRLLTRHGWSYSPYAMPYFVGGVAFSHVPLTIMSRPLGGELTSANVALKAVNDWVYGHNHRADVARRPKLGGVHTTALNLGCYLPDGHVERYIKVGSMHGWWYGIWEISISGGRIKSYGQHAISELEERYG